MQPNPIQLTTTINPLTYPPHRFMNPYRNPVHAIMMALIAFFSLTTSCIRQEDSAEVTVDTLETDFFDNMKSANAIKTYTGMLACDSCEGIYTELTINEDSLTYRLAEKHVNDTIQPDTLVSEGSFTRNSMVSGQPGIQLNDTTNKSSWFFEASGDTLLYMLLEDGESRKEGEQITLKRK